MPLAPFPENNFSAISITVGLVIISSSAPVRCSLDALGSLSLPTESTTDRALSFNRPLMLGMESDLLDNNNTPASNNATLPTFTGKPP